MQTIYDILPNTNTDVGTYFLEVKNGTTTVATAGTTWQQTGTNSAFGTTQDTFSGAAIAFTSDSSLITWEDISNASTVTEAAATAEWGISVGRWAEQKNGIGAVAANRSWTANSTTWSVNNIHLADTIGTSTAFNVAVGTYTFSYGNNSSAGTTTVFAGQVFVGNFTTTGNMTLERTVVLSNGSIYKRQTSGASYTDWSLGSGATSATYTRTATATTRQKGIARRAFQVTLGTGTNTTVFWASADVGGFGNTFTTVSTLTRNLGWFSSGFSGGGLTTSSGTQGFAAASSNALVTLTIPFTSTNGTTTATTWRAVKGAAGTFSVADTTVIANTFGTTILGSSFGTSVVTWNKTQRYIKNVTYSIDINELLIVLDTSTSLGSSLSIIGPDQGFYTGSTTWASLGNDVSLITSTTYTKTTAVGGYTFGVDASFELWNRNHQITDGRQFAKSTQGVVTTRVVLAGGWFTAGGGPFPAFSSFTKEGWDFAYPVWGWGNAGVQVNGITANYTIYRGARREFNYFSNSSYSTVQAGVTWNVKISGSLLVGTSDNGTTTGVSTVGTQGTFTSPNVTINSFTVATNQIRIEGGAGLHFAGISSGVYRAFINNAGATIITQTGFSIITADGGQTVLDIMPYAVLRTLSTSHTYSIPDIGTSFYTGGTTAPRPQVVATQVDTGLGIRQLGMTGQSEATVIWPNPGFTT